MSEIQDNSIYWVEIERISPNPFQPRREFDQGKLSDLAESIRQYGVLQPLVVTRKETQKEDGGLFVEYELIAGERRLRASKLGGLSRVPVIIRTGHQSDRLKLELAIIENLQREDLNAVDRARAFEKLVNEFKFKHIEVARKVGKSREYVSNTLRLLLLPEEMQSALSTGEISEGHARPILMLNDRKDEQVTLFKEVMLRKLTVRETEAIARNIAQDKIRKRIRSYSPEIIELEQKLKDALGTRVQIESREIGGKLVIDFFSEDDLRNILQTLQPENKEENMEDVQNNVLQSEETREEVSDNPVDESVEGDAVTETGTVEAQTNEGESEVVEEKFKDENEDEHEEDPDLYSIRNFSI